VIPAVLEQQAAGFLESTSSKTEGLAR
jgi:hypothetical protein